MGLKREQVAWFDSGMHFLFKTLQTFFKENVFL